MSSITSLTQLGLVPGSSSPAPVSAVDAALVIRVFNGTMTDADQVALYNMHRPTTVAQFVSLLHDAHVNAFARELASVLTLDASADVDEKRRAVAGLMNQSAKLKAQLSSNVDSKTTYVPPTIDSLVNNVKGLNLLLANPMLAQVVMEKRKRDTELAKARLSSVNSGVLGLPLPLLGPNSVLVQLGQRGGAQLNPLYPIEMRGAGRIFAEMRGGAGWVIGTTLSPTAFRPLSDESFISNSLEVALNNLVQTLKQKGSTLEATTETNVRTLVEQLRSKEAEVRKRRDELNTMSQILGSQNTKPGASVNETDIKDTIEAYNQSNTSRQKLENKLFRVIIALGNQVKTFP